MTMMQPRAAEGFALPPAFCVDIDKLFFFSSEQRVVSEQKSLSRREISLETDDRVKSFSMVFARALCLLTPSWNARFLLCGDSREKKFGKKGKFRV